MYAEWGPVSKEVDEMLTTGIILNERHASRDAAGNVINDPYPTNFPSGGFDLDAVGAIYQYNTAVGNVTANSPLRVFPNPASNNITISLTDDMSSGTTISISALTGNVVYSAAVTTNATTISIAQYPAGIYYLTVNDSNGGKWTEKIVKY